MLRDGQILTGSIDLVWQTNEGDILIDFKSCPMSDEYILNPDSEHYVGYYAGQLNAYTDALEPDASSIFCVSGPDGREFRIIIIGNGSAVIAGCKAGETYTVTEETAWSWQYAPDNTEQTVVISPDGSEVVFTNSTVKDSWLTDSTGAVNDSSCLED